MPRQCAQRNPGDGADSQHPGGKQRRELRRHDTGEGVRVRGAGQVREFFIGFVANLTPEMLANFSATRQEVDGEIAYVVWTIGDIIPFGTDTFVVRDGKIVTRTIAVYVPS